MFSLYFPSSRFTGDLVSCYGHVTKIGTTSVTVHVDVYENMDNPNKGAKVACGDFVNVALDDKGKPRIINPRYGYPL